MESGRCGYIYSWQALIQEANAYYAGSYIPSEPHQGLCPSGWHLPSINEILTLDLRVGGTAGVNVAQEPGMNFWRAGYGFDLLPVGTANYNTGALTGQGTNAFVFTSTRNSNTAAYYAIITPTYINFWTILKRAGVTTRCVANS